jgi:hypothetical protein
MQELETNPVPEDVLAWVGKKRQGDDERWGE